LAMLRLRAGGADVVAELAAQPRPRSVEGHNAVLATLPLPDTHHGAGGCIKDVVEGDRADLGQTQPGADHEGQQEAVALRPASGKEGAFLGLGDRPWLLL